MNVIFTHFSALFGQQGVCVRATRECTLVVARCSTFALHQVTGNAMMEVKLFFFCLRFSQMFVREAANACCCKCCYNMCNLM